MFCKLALKNVAKSYRDYSVYFLTLCFGVCLFYTFNALDSQWVMVKLSQNSHSMAGAIMTIVGVFSALVSVVLACLVVYANGFLMKRRKKELGLYLLLGLPTGRVALLLVLETLFMGVFALAVGLALGVLASQGLGLLTLSMFSASLEEMVFVFSLPAVFKTMLYFGVIFLVVMVLTTIAVSKAKLLELMQGGRRNEELRERPLWASVVLFLAGVLLLVVAYWMLLTRLLLIDALFFLMLGLGALGTLLFFRSLSGFVLRFVKGRPGLYYRGLNMFVLRQFNSRIHTTYLSMTVVCLLLLLAIGITASSVGLNNTIESHTTDRSPYDLTVVNYNYSGAAEDVDLDDCYRAVGIEPADFSAARHTYLLRYNDPEQTGVHDANAAIALTDYNALLALRGMPAIALSGDAPLAAGEGLMNAVSMSALVVPDAMAAELPIRRQVANYQYTGDKAVAEDALLGAAERESFSMQGGIQCYSRLVAYYDQMGSKILVLFLGLYLGILFLLTAAAVLALQQLSQAADNAPRYALLSRLGAERSLRDQSVFLQVALAFALPLLLALVHAFVGMSVVNTLIAQVGEIDARAGSGTAAGLLLLVYGAYFVATCLVSRSVAREAR